MEGNEKKSPPPVGTGDRRSGNDRRKTEAGPPGGRERRRNLESRKPEVAEIDLTLSQWDALNEQPPAGKRPAD